MGKMPEVDNPVGNFLDGIIAFRAENARRFQCVRQHVVVAPNLAILQKRKFASVNMQNVRQDTLEILVIGVDLLLAFAGCVVHDLFDL